MRIIHTADWHIGQTLSGFERDHEHAAVLADLTRVADEREADAMIVAGDVFEHQNPSGEAQRLFFETIMALKRARPAMQIVVTAGNHDAAGRLEAPRALLAGLGVHVTGSVRRRDGRIDSARHLVALKDRRGEVAAHVLAVSYPTAACLPSFASLEAPDGVSPVVEATRALYAELMEATGAGRDGLPLIVTGHLHVAGGIESEGAERRILVGGAHAVPPSVFPEAAAYVALGHLHKAQAIGRETVRYSGSLLPLSAAELNYKHGVSLVTIGEGPTRIEHVPLVRPVAFRRLPDTGDMRLDELADRLTALDVPADCPRDLRPFVQLRLSRDGLPAGFRAEVDRIADAFPVRVVDIKVTALPSVAGEAAPMPLVRLAELAPEDIFRRAFERARGAPPETAHLDAFHQAASAAAAMTEA